MKNIDLTKYGITGTTEIVHNPSYEELFAEETKPGLEATRGPGQRTGRRQRDDRHLHRPFPQDKFIVMDETSKDTVWWTTPEYKNDNKPASKEAWAACKKLAIEELSNKKL